jgi:hypothetical protein
MKLKAKNIKPLEGNHIAPPLEMDKVYDNKEVFTCDCGQEHYDVGLTSIYNYVTCYKCKKELPKGHTIHWCHPSRFEIVE